MGRLSKVQDTWGNSLVRKKVMGLDAAYPKSKRSKTAQQQAAADAGPSAEPEAEPFSKPKLKKGCIWIKQQKALLVAESTFSDVTPSDGVSCNVVRNEP